MNKQSIDVVDFHSHILPRDDHGSSSVDTSLAQLDLARNAGVTRIVATPHFYHHKHTLDHFIARRADAADALFKAAPSGSPTVKLGAEVLLCEGLENFNGLESLCLGNTKYILLELPFADFREEYCTTVRKIIKSGIDVILAHVDRYDKENIERMYDVGVRKFQLNAESLAGLFKKKHLLEWAGEGLVVALGSDIHGADSKAYRRFEKAKKALADSLNMIKEKSDEIFSLM